MRCLVTGVAGFIGSHLAHRLLTLGHEVVGIDSFNSYYSPVIKRRNVAVLCEWPAFQVVEADISVANLEPLVEGAEWVFHLAGQPGVRGSWGRQFAEYDRCNIWATQRLLEALRVSRPQRFVYASSSSVYGDGQLPMREDAHPQPLSPYGITKLAAEHLIRAYWRSYELRTIVLRFFTVYGPRQRPDMALHRFIYSITRCEPIQLHGDGSQTRDFTYVDDVIEACLRAAIHECTGEVVNVGSGLSFKMNEVLHLLSEIIGQPVTIEPQANQHGDVHHSLAAVERARSLLGWQAAVPLVEGLCRQVEWQLG